MEGYKKDTQLKINFDENKAEVYEKKQREAGEKFGIINYKELVQKEDGEWYMHGIEASKYNEIMSENDNTDLYKRPIKPNEISKSVIKKAEPNKRGPVMIPFDPEK